ncbi:MAG: hypothetical protein SOZ07_08875 [Prevotella sp.]|nr:hypothetical protein [Prevotella sp.]
MKKIMFNDNFFLTQAVLDETKTMTRRLYSVPSRFRDVDICGFTVFTNALGEQYVALTDEDEHIVGYWRPAFEVGEIVAIAQSYRELYSKADFEMTGKVLMTESAGWSNKMFVKADLMKHHIQIVDVRVERLQKISDEDCLREGIKERTNVINEKEYYVDANTDFLYLRNGHKDYFSTPRQAFAALVDKINGKGTWERNPWVVVYTFGKID